MAAKMPEFQHVVPTLVVEDPAEAIDFYTKAFGATELYRFKGPDGRIMHAEIKIGDTRLMLGPGCPESNYLPPSKLQGSSCSFFLYVPDVDAAFDKAVSAGAKAEMNVEDMFWGDRMGQVVDPFGHRWSLATHVEDLSESQIQERAEQFFASRAGAPLIHSQCRAAGLADGWSRVLAIPTERGNDARLSITYSQCSNSLRTS